MNKRSAIFIFTRDSPERAVKCLSGLSLCDHQKVLVDDSQDLGNQTALATLCKEQGHTHLGLREYEQFLAAKDIDASRFTFLLREPGFPSWNLGYMRNLALLFARSAGFNRVLYMDDDIRVPNPALVDELLGQLEHTGFAGAYVDGMPDQSILGHIANEVGVVNPEMLSGGFLAFNPENVTEHFVNIYNEDWIWVFLQSLTQKYVRYGSVDQDEADRYENFESKVIFQEYGETIVDGLVEAQALGSHEQLTSVAFWHQMLTERVAYLDDLLARATAQKRTLCIKILKNLMTNRPLLSPEQLQAWFIAYQADRETFRELFSSLR